MLKIVRSALFFALFSSLILIGAAILVPSLSQVLGITAFVLLYIFMGMLVYLRIRLTEWKYLILWMYLLAPIVIYGTIAVMAFLSL